MLTPENRKKILKKSSPRQSPTSKNCLPDAIHFLLLQFRVTFPLFSIFSRTFSPSFAVIRLFVYVTFITFGGRPKTFEPASRLRDSSCLPPSSWPRCGCPSHFVASFDHAFVSIFVSGQHYKLLVVGGGAGGLGISHKFARKLPKGAIAVVEPHKVRKRLFSPSFCG